MAYDENKLTNLKALRTLAQRINRDFATKASVTALEDRIDNLATVGGEPNVITAIKVNGTALPVENKAVNVPVPTAVSELTNDSKFQSDTQVSAAIQTAIAATGHAVFQKVDAVPAPEEAQDNVLYLVMNADTGHYDIYAKVGERVELLDDTTVDLTGYVEKEEGKGLSSNDFTDALLSKLNSVAEGATKVEAQTGSGTLTINGQQYVLFGVATDAEVQEMLTEVLGSAAR